MHINQVLALKGIFSRQQTKRLQTSNVFELAALAERVNPAPTPAIVFYDWHCPSRLLISLMRL